MKAKAYLREHSFALASIAGALVVIFINIYVANHVSVVLPMVDGWAVWNRVLLFNAGAMGLKDYLFKPHGAHLHSIVYLLAWFDYRFSNADQSLMRFFSMGAVTIFAGAVSWAVWTWGTKHARPKWLIALVTIATAALLTSVIDNETMIQPFQVVLSASRLFYFALLASIVISLVRNKPLLYLASIAVSTIAVSFHGSGYIFAGLLVVAHILLTRRKLALLFAFFPLVSVFVFQKIFTDGGGELSQLDKVLTPGAVLVFIQSSSAYFAMPFRALRAVLGDLGLVTLGFVMMTTTTILTFGAFREILRNRGGWRAFLTRSEEAPEGGAWFEEAYAIIFLTGSFLLLSAAAAGVFWIVRTSGPGHLPAYMEVFVSTRYTAYSTLGLVLLMGFSLGNPLKVPKAITTIIAVAFVALALWPAARINKIYLADDQLNRAAAALSTGISPIHPEAEVVWPQAGTDWYWSNALPKTVAQLRLEQKSMWAHIPPLGTTVDGTTNRLPHALIKIRAIEGERDKCGLEGTLPDSRSYSSGSALLALVSLNREVVGYITMMRHKFNAEGRRIDGFFVCSANDPPPEFFAVSSVKWHQNPNFKGKPWSAADVTDAHWLKGVSRNEPALIVKDSSDARQRFINGTIIRLSDGQFKVVTDSKSQGQTLIIRFDGGQIDGNVNGFPAMIEIIK